MLNKVIIAFGTAFATAFTVALGIDIREHNKVLKKIGIATEDIKQASAKEIKESIIEEAVKEAATAKVGSYVNSANSAIMANARTELEAEVKKAVNNASVEVKNKVAEKVTEEVAKIDITDLKKSARDKAEAKILEKFDGNLEDLLAKFNENLSNIQKIYGGIADAISKGKEDKGLKFTIG